MPGAPEFNNQSIIQAMESKRVRFLDLSFTDVVLSNELHTVEIFAPTGYMSTVYGCYMEYPKIAGATSGTYLVSALVAGGDIGIVFGEGAPLDVVKYSYGRWFTPITTSYPDAGAAAYSAQKGMAIFDEVNSLRVLFWNKTDVSDGGSTKSLKLWVVDEKIA